MRSKANYVLTIFRKTYMFISIVTSFETLYRSLTLVVVLDKASLWLEKWTFCCLGFKSRLRRGSSTGLTNTLVTLFVIANITIFASTSRGPLLLSISKKCYFFQLNRLLFITFYDRTLQFINNHLFQLQ